MKLISTAAGTTALKISGDDVSPDFGIHPIDLMDFIAGEYQFAVRPNIPPGISPFAIGVHTYQTGVYANGEGKRYPITQLSMAINGDIVTAANTDIAEEIMRDLTKKLENMFGYKYSNTRGRKLYHSALVVQFDSAFEEKINILEAVQRILSERLVGMDRQYKLKRLSFGYGDLVQTFYPNTIEALESADFQIERRNGEPYEENRYFCLAPFSTWEHLDVLQQIERLVG